MEKTKNNLKNKIFVAVTKELSDLGFHKTKSTFWTKEYANTIQFIHIHSFSFDYSFRIHLGIRVKNDSFEAAALNGPCINDGWWKSETIFSCKKYLNFSNEIDSITECSNNILGYINIIGIPWFDEFKNDNQLLTNPKSPLNKDQKLALSNVLSGNLNPDNVILSKKVLGIK
jgi:hypothetical protein